MRSSAFATFALCALLSACDPTDPAGLTPPAARASLTSRPNVLLILTDDQDVPSLAVMPNVQALLVARGVSFTNSYATTSLCCPGRSSILRGQYAHNHGVKSNHAPAGGFTRAKALGIESSTLATWLHDAGYRTGFFGKYLNDYERVDAGYVPAGWDEWQMFDTYWLSWVAENGALVIPPAGTYNADAMAARAGAFMVQAVQDGRPFFTWAAFKAPHEPQEPAARHLGRFATYPVPRPPSFNVPKPGISELHKAVLMVPDTIAKLDADYRRRLETLLSVDEAVARFVAVLDSLGVLGNTLIIYTSDNGWFSGEHAIPSNKNMSYQEAIRVPLVIRGPGIQRAAKHHIALNIDLAPTVADFAGVTVPAFVDGRSLKGVLLGGTPIGDWRTTFMTEHWKADGTSIVSGLHTKVWSYLEWGSGAREYFDLKTDPWEMAAPIAAGTRKAQRDELARFRACAAATCRALDGGG